MFSTHGRGNEKVCGEQSGRPVQFQRRTTGQNRQLAVAAARDRISQREAAKRTVQK